MKLLLFLIASTCAAQTSITGPLYDTSGTPATCQLAIRPLSVPGYAPSYIGYLINAGDLSGTTGGYGWGLTNITRYSPLALFPGTYSAEFGCTAGQFDSHTYLWTIGGSTVTIQSLIGLSKSLGQITTTLGNTPSTLGAQ